MAKRIGFIGLGIMGRPMSKNLLKAGFPLTVYNRTKSKMAELVEAGARPAGSPREVAQVSDVVITMVSDSPDVVQVVEGPEGVFEGARPGLILIDMSTISPRVTQELAESAAQRGISWLDAPVTGGERGAIDGKLSIMVGGPEDAYRECLPIFEALGNRVTYMGQSGSGQMTKLCNQIICALNILAICEGLTFAAKAGLDLKKVLNVVTGGSAASWMLQNLGPKITERDFAPGFLVRLQDKDLRLVLETAQEIGASLPGTGLTKQLFQSAKALGFGEEGTQALAKVIERLSGLMSRE